MQKEILEILQQKGIKKTPQRLEILMNLAQRRDHPTVEEIYNDIKEKFSGISVATVYINLETFVKHGIIRKINTDDGLYRYDFAVKPHVHFYDIENLRIIDFENERFYKALQRLLERLRLKNYEIVDFNFEIKVKPKK
ncbi:MAG: Fur family transcriptional regulator [Candidatus Micrarchaeia archaeon]